MELLHINGTSGNKQCSISISEDTFVIEGDFYYLQNKEFYPVKNGKASSPIKEYMGLGSLHKRSPKKLIQFVVIACVLELFNMIAGKLSDYLFFTDTSWTAYFVNAVALLCLIQGLRLFFSKKKVIEISFLSKRICVDENIFCEEDIKKLNQIILGTTTVT
jgi:hypothetical protein